ncbi:MAG TPA: chemotaxis protein CheD [Candidatus Cloacimonadota bacterium]|jgi:chemotaxis protein CheD|nr:chemotaxis protein CheD [Candidatus Cloacimonadales bacterium]HPY95861.1 chemotaxis protein CheD [Candidatus Cloacimonadota bacterium]HQB41044.1 chemotaxis protein CheD [Candidatus Cloacimonadota bacterium]
MNYNLIGNKYLIKPGYLIVNHDPTLVYGVVGSGMFVALWDEKKSYSACCSFLYPFTNNKENLRGIYGNVAINWLIKKMKDQGSDIKDLKAHLMGGATNNMHKIGEENINIAKRILDKQNIEIITTDIGGKMGRKFIFDCQNGQSVTFKTNKIRKSDWYPYPSNE